MEDHSPTPEEAHKEEILEAVIDAAMRGESEGFAAFKEEWERIDPLDDEGWHLRFPQGDPIPYTAQGFCFHCGKPWAVSGIAFGTMVPGLAQVIHMSGECDSAGDCYCWIDDTEGEDRPYGYARCQRCARAEPICECDDGMAYGPCALFERHEREQGFNWIGE